MWSQLVVNRFEADCGVSVDLPSAVGHLSEVLQMIWLWVWICSTLRGEEANIVKNMSTSSFDNTWKCLWVAWMKTSVVWIFVWEPAAAFKSLTV